MEARVRKADRTPRVWGTVRAAWTPKAASHLPETTRVRNAGYLALFVRTKKHVLQHPRSRCGRVCYGRVLRLLATPWRPGLVARRKEHPCAHHTPPLGRCAKPRTGRNGSEGWQGARSRAPANFGSKADSRLTCSTCSGAYPTPPDSGAAPKMDHHACPKMGSPGGCDGKHPNCKDKKASRYGLEPARVVISARPRAHVLS